MSTSMESVRRQSGFCAKYGLPPLGGRRGHVRTATARKARAVHVGAFVLVLVTQFLVARLYGFVTGEGPIANADCSMASPGGSPSAHLQP